VPTSSTSRARRLRLAVVLAAVALPLGAACAPVGQGAPPDIYSKLNAFRAHYGVPPVAGCGSLGAIAQSHAEGMAARGHLSHDGFPNRLQVFYGGYRWGEVVAYGQPTTDAVLWAWMASPGHRAQLLDPAFQHVGFGHAGGFWAGDFGAGGTC
jgi:uncharacterized protein YkwD